MMKISIRKPKSSRRPPISWSSFSGPALLSPSTNIVKEITVDMMLRAKPAEETLNGVRREYFIPTQPTTINNNIFRVSNGWRDLAGLIVLAD